MTGACGPFELHSTHIAATAKTWSVLPARKKSDRTRACRAYSTLSSALHLLECLQLSGSLQLHMMSAAAASLDKRRINGPERVHQPVFRRSVSPAKRREQADKPGESSTAASSESKAMASSNNSGGGERADGRTKQELRPICKCCERSTLRPNCVPQHSAPAMSCAAALLKLSLTSLSNLPTLSSFDPSAPLLQS